MGPLAARLRWLLPAIVLVVLIPSGASAQVPAPLTTALYFKSEAGDFVGAGQEKTYMPADVTFTISSTTNGVSGRVYDESPFTFWWDFRFTAPAGVSLAPGVHNTARGWPTTPFNGLDFSGSGRGCNTKTGRFVILEAEYGSGGTVLKFAADFEQHCEDANAGLFGAIRYNSTISSLTPFGGAFPSTASRWPRHSMATYRPLVRWIAARAARSARRHLRRRRRCRSRRLRILRRARSRGSRVPGSSATTTSCSSPKVDVASSRVTKCA
jgi:hypothetical protein